ncbi:hypothetical protein Ancab_036787 [Ancistrocladus abbreviatus]
MLQEETIEKDNVVRWELGACWIQHLQDQKNAKKDKKPSAEKNKSERKVQGLRTPLRSLKNKKAEGRVQVPSEVSKSHVHGVNSVSSSTEVHKVNDGELVLRKVLSDAAFHTAQRIRNRTTPKGKFVLRKWKCPSFKLAAENEHVFSQALQELIDLSHKYYDEVALPKLVADFGSLELSPVDGRTLTDFMHTRGLRMHSLGRVVKLSEKLSHVRSLCIHEMIVQAYKHVLQAVIASVGVDDMAVFLMKRYDWDISGFNYKDLRKFAILRGLCQKVGIELVPRDYNMNSPVPFHMADIVSLIPVPKQAPYSSANGRQLLESSKTALDKGKLEEAVNDGTKALAKLIAVCGPYHRMTAGAYSLLAVVLYHTGDFNQHPVVMYATKLGVVVGAGIRSKPFK